MRLRFAALLLFALTPFAAHAASPSYASLQWNLRQIHTQAAWNLLGQGTSVSICDVDTGLAPNLADFRGQVTSGTNTIDARTPTDYSDGNGHGTFTASEMVANGTTLWGVAPRARLLVAKVLSDDGSGGYGSVTAGIFWCLSHGAQVINMSLGGPAAIYDGLQDTINYACARGVDFAVAAGNDSSSTPSDPAHIHSRCLVAANALTRKRTLAQYSSFGQNAQTVSAPGSNVPGLFANGSPGLDSGTSMAAPEVAGGLALLRSAGANQYQAVDYLLLTARPLHQFRDKALDRQFFGYGEMDLAAAASMWMARARD